MIQLLKYEKGLYLTHVLYFNHFMDAWTASVREYIQTWLDGVELKCIGHYYLFIICFCIISTFLKCVVEWGKLHCASCRIKEF